MLKRSLQILVLCALLTLTAIVGFALLRLRGPEDTLREARDKLAAGRFAEVIALLDQTAPSASVRDDRGLRERLWRLRLEAHSRIGNPAGALQDVRNLLANGHADDVDLLLDEIRLLASDGQGERARLRARQFLEDHPEHPRGLELAGESCQTAYQPLRRELLDAVEGQLAKASREAARAALRTYLHRPDGDPMVARAGGELERLFSVEPRLVAAWPQIWERAQRLRARVQEALGYFRRCLDLGGETVAAFRAVATALERSGRLDDLLLLCEIQRRRFEHAYVIDSGVLAAWVRIQADMPEAAIQTAERWLPTDEIEDRAAADRLPAKSEQLALARTLAAWRLRSRPEAIAAGRVISALRDTGLQARLPLHLSLATRKLLTTGSDPREIESSLERVVEIALQELPTPGRPDFVAEFAPIWIDTMLSRAATEEEVLAALRRWQQGRPDDVAPRLRAARYLLAIQRTAAALAAIDDAVALDPDHPGLFELRLEVARSHYDNTEQSGASLLTQCADSGKLVPETTDAIGYVLCAEAAMALDQPRAARVALACARSAIGSFPRADIPRQLELRALLRLGLDREAARAAELTVRALSPAPATLALAIEAQQRAGQPIRSLLRLAIPAVRSNDNLQLELLRVALIDAPATAARFVTAELIAADAPLRHRLLATRAFAAAGRTDDALAQLRAAAPTDDPELRAMLDRAFADWLLAAADRPTDGPSTDGPSTDGPSTDGDLRAIVRTERERLQLAAGPQTAQLAAAVELAEGHPLTASDLLEDALAAAAPQERNGALYVLAGELALQRGDLVRAEHHWLAALGFADGIGVAERLTRLLLLTDREQRAQQVYGVVAQPTDGALAARFGRLEQAATLLGADLQREPADLLTHAALATFGQQTLVDWQAPQQPELQQARLELLTGLREPGLAALTLPRARGMLTSDPRRRVHYLLTARALADAGQPAAAGRLHAELFQAGFLNPVLLREVAHAGQHDDYDTDEELLKKVMEAASSGSVAGSRLTLRYGMELVAEGFERGGFPDLAAQTRLAQWLNLPQLEPCTRADVERITSGLSARDACYVLDQVLQGPHPVDRELLLREFYRLADALLTEDPTAAPRLVPMAIGHLRSDGALGRIVHFVLQHPVDEPAIDEPALLLQHLEAIATGRDDAALLDATLEELERRTSAGNVQRRVDALLDRFPTALSLWAAHVRLRARLQSDPTALDDLRTVLTHAGAPHAELAFLSLAATEFGLTPTDVERLEQLPPALLDEPDGQYVRGLVALRRGDAGRAVALLQKAAPQPDGHHLLALALALLESDADGSIDGAIAALQQLETGYPSSSVARYAGSFARQLSPPPASADDSDSNR